MDAAEGESEAVGDVTLGGCWDAWEEGGDCEPVRVDVEPGVEADVGVEVEAGAEAEVEVEVEVILPLPAVSLV